MKKNILTIIIMASCLVNLVLSIVLVFSVMPAMNKTGNLVDKVAEIIDLEIEKDADAVDYEMSDLETYEIALETKMTINLQKDADDENSHYAQVQKIVLSFNTAAEDYATVNESVQKANVYITDIVKETISDYAISNWDEQTARKVALKKIQEKYNTKAIVDVSFPDCVVS